MSVYQSMIQIPGPKKRKRCDAAGAFYPEPTTTVTHPQTVTNVSENAPDEDFNTPLHPDNVFEEFDNNEPFPTHYNILLESPLDHMFDDSKVFPDQILSPPAFENLPEQPSPMISQQRNVARPPPPPRPSTRNVDIIPDELPLFFGSNTESNDAESGGDVLTVDSVTHEQFSTYRGYPRLEVRINGLMGERGKKWILKKKNPIEVYVSYQGDPQGLQYFLNHVRPSLIGFGLPRTRMKKQDYTVFQSRVNSTKTNGIILQNYLDGSSVMSIVHREVQKREMVTTIRYRITCDVGSNQSGDWRFSDGYRIGFCQQPGPIWFFSEPFKVKSRKPTSGKRRRKKKPPTMIDEDEDDDYSSQDRMVSNPPPQQQPYMKPSDGISQLNEFPIQEDPQGNSRMMCFFHAGEILSKNDFSGQANTKPHIFEFPAPTVPMWFGNPYVGYAQLFPDGMFMGNNDGDGWSGSMLLRNAKIHVVIGQHSQQQKRFNLKVRLGGSSVIHVVNNPSWSITHESQGHWSRPRPFMGREAQVGRASSYLAPNREGQEGKVSKVHLRVRVDESKGLLEIEDTSKNGTELYLPVKVLIGDGVRYYVSYERKNQVGVQRKRYRLVVSKKKLEEDDTTTKTPTTGLPQKRMNFLKFEK